MKIASPRLITCAILCIMLCSAAWAKPLVFAVWSDTHFGAYDFSDTTRLRIIDQVNKLGEKDLPDGLKDSLAGSKVSFLLHCGDITENGEPQQWNDPNAADQRSYLKAIKLIDPAIKVYAVLGNHDSRKEGNVRKEFSELYGGTYYSFDEQGVHFVALDPYPQMNTPAPSLDKKQLAWLKADMAKISDTTPVVIVMHPVPVNDETINRASKIDQESLNQLYEIISKKNVLAFLHGHWHKQSVKKFNGIPVIEPAGFEYFRSACKNGDPVIGVVVIDNNDLTVYSYDWEKEAFEPKPLTTVKK